jgi:CRP-like cAMP-binding protein
MTEIYGHHVRKSYVFSDVDEPFTRQLCQYLKRVIFFPGNFIVQHGDFDNSMYFIHHGEVDILTVHPNLTETIHEVLRTGDMFGVTQGLFPNVPHHFSYRARTRVHIVVLHFSDWEHLLNFFPENKDTILMKTTNVNV